MKLVHACECVYRWLVLQNIQYRWLVLHVWLASCTLLYVLYGVKYIDLVSLAPFSGPSKRCRTTLMKCVATRSSHPLASLSTPLLSCWTRPNSLLPWVKTSIGARKRFLSLTWTGHLTWLPLITTGGGCWESTWNGRRTAGCVAWINPHCTTFQYYMAAL